MKYKKIVMAGFKHCGKSLIGSLLAERVGFGFLDIDSLIVENYHNAHGERMGVRDIYSKIGKSGFEKLEAEALLIASQREGVVLSLGGGSPMNEGFDKSNFKDSLFIYLNVDPDILFNRIESGGFPPFYDAENPRKSFDQLFDDRTPYYEQIADVTVSNSGRKPIDIVSEISEKMEMN